MKRGKSQLRRYATAMAVLAVLATQASALAAEGPRLTTVSRATKGDLAPARTYTGPFLLADPEDQTRIFAAAAELRSRTCHLLRSNDAGRSWTLLMASPSPPSYPFCSTSSGMLTQTPMAWGRDRTLYYATHGWDTQDGGPAGNVSVVLARSTDFGDTWETTIVRDARGRSGPEAEANNAVASLAVDTKSAAQDIVYVGWRANYPNAPSLPSGLRPLRPPLVAASVDGGRTFSEPIDVSKFYTKTVKGPDGADLPVGMSFTAPSLAVDDKGTLFALYPAAPPSAFPPTFALPKLPMLLARSTDRGKTFTFTEAGPPLNYNEGVQILRWSPEGGGDGTLHMVFEDKLEQPTGSADRDIYYVRSTDGGSTFSPPQRLNDDNPAELRVQATPNISVAPNGRLDAAWWDFRNDPGTFVNDVYASFSTDNGETWSKNVRVTDRSIDRKLGVWTNGFDIRQPPGIASGPQLTVFGWDDTRLGDDLTETQDVFSRAVQHAPLGAATNAPARYAIAAVVGLAVVGVVLLALSRRRQTTAASGAPAGRRDQESADVKMGAVGSRERRR